MFQYQDFWLPEGERHWLSQDLEGYQLADRQEAYKHVRNWSLALDLGANIGIFSRDFAKRFDQVVAFEPIPAIRECLERNVPGNVRVEPFALSDRAGDAIMRQVVKSSGGSFIANDPEIAAPSAFALTGPRAITVQLTTIDSYSFDGVGLIKLDIQGAEHLALKGAENTIRRCRPVISMEEKPRAGDVHDMANCKKAAEFLMSLGMTPKKKALGDRAYVFED